MQDAIYTLYEALEQPEQEPVGSLSVWYHLGSKSMTNVDFDYNGDLPEGDYELYTTPPAAQRTWVELTDEDLEFWTEELGQGELGKGVIRAVANHLKERNT
jgi:hypothetical protein